MIKLEKIALKSISLASSAVKKTIPIARTVCNAIRPLEKDVVQFSGQFTPMERKLMDEVRQYGAEKGVETYRLVDKRGQEITDIDKIELPMTVSVLPKQGWSAVSKRLFGRELLSDKPIFTGSKFNALGYLVEALLKYRGTTLIHNHLAKMPLSSMDFSALIILGFKKAIAVSPDGSVSCLTNTSLRNRLLNCRKIYNKYKECSNSVSSKIQELGIKSSQELLNASPEKLEELSKHQGYEIQKLAKATGAHYYSEGF